MKRRHGLPIRGYNGVTPRHLAPTSDLTADSYDCLIDPNDGKFYTRPGSRLIGSWYASTTVSGITYTFENYTVPANLMSGSHMRIRQVVELNAPQLANPTFCALVSDDSSWGTLAFQSTLTFSVANCSMTANSNVLTLGTGIGVLGLGVVTDATRTADLTPGCTVTMPGLPAGVVVVGIGTLVGGLYTTVSLSWAPPANISGQTATFGSAMGEGGNWRMPAYFDNPTNATGGGGSGYYAASRFICVPVIGKTNRLKSADERSRIAHGSTHLVQTQRHVFMGNGTTGHRPTRWNMEWNDRFAGGTRIARYFPMGNIPPVWLKVNDGTGAIAGTKPNYDVDDALFCSLQYRYKDGSLSQPFVPQQKPGSQASGIFYGLHIVEAACDYITYTFPDPPDDVDEILVLATRKGTKEAPPPLYDEDGNSLLGIVDVIKPGVGTYKNYKGGNALNYVFDPTIVNFKHAWPGPTRYLWAGDGAIWGGYVHPLADAIIICPDLTGNDQSVSGQYAYVTVSSTTLALVQSDNAGTATNTFSFTLADYATLQDLLNAINATVPDGTVGKTMRWKAALVPGADPNASPASLAVTTNIDFGDFATHTKLRAFANSIPAVLSMNSTWIGLRPIKKGSFWKGIGGPTLKPMCPDTKVANEFTAPGHWGYFVAAGAINEWQIVAFSKAIGIVKVKDGQPKLDENYHLYPLNQNRGCICAESFVIGDGWVGYLTQDGYVVNDGQTEVVISGAMYNGAGKAGERGPWESIITELMASLNTLDGNNQCRLFSAEVVGNVLLAYWGSLLGSTTEGRYAVYDFSRGAAGAGLAEVLTPEGQPWAWSTPCRITRMGGRCGTINGPDGRRTYIVGSVAGDVHRMLVHRIFTNDGYDVGLNQIGNNGQALFSGTTVLGNPDLTMGVGVNGWDRIAIGAVLAISENSIGGGVLRFPIGARVLSKPAPQVLRMDRNALVTGTAFSHIVGALVLPRAYHCADFCNAEGEASGLGLKSFQEAKALYRKPFAQGTGPRMTVYNRADRQQGQAMVLPVTNTDDPYKLMPIPFPQASRGPAELVEILIEDDGSTPALQYWGHEIELEALAPNRNTRMS